MMSKILVTGCNGQLGKTFKELAKYEKNMEFVFVSREDFDLSDLDSIEKYFSKIEVDVIINCAAYTNVDSAESEAVLADKINHLAVRKMAEICKEKNIFILHVSTDYVFGGTNCVPYAETDIAGPINIYGKTKLIGEKALQEINPKGMIIRTSWVYSEFGNNFVKSMLMLSKKRDTLNVIYDQIGAPTYAKDLAGSIINIVKAQGVLETDIRSNIYHYSNSGVSSWYDFAKAIFEYSKQSCNVEPIESSEYTVIAKRPQYSLLNSKKIKRIFGVELPYWRESLKVCLNKIESNQIES